MALSAAVAGVAAGLLIGATGSAGGFAEGGGCCAALLDGCAVLSGGCSGEGGREVLVTRLKMGLDCSRGCGLGLAFPDAAGRLGGRRLLGA